MSAAKGFGLLLDEIKGNPIEGLPKTSYNKRYNYIQYAARFDGELHYEILDGREGGRISDRNGNRLYQPDVAYVELHFERHSPNTNLSGRRIAYFAKHIAKVKGPFRFIPEWGGRGAPGFSLRYVPPGNALEGVCCSETPDISKVRSELVKNLKNFVEFLDPVLDKLTEKFEMEEGAMIEIDTYCELLENAKQIILTGAPGTGKTYLARQVARSIVLSDEEKGLSEEEIEKLIQARTAFVQFHPAYDYTDFVEGLRPIRGADGNVGFKRKDGAFKELCKSAVDDAQNFVMIIDEINRGDISKIFGELFYAIDDGYRGPRGRVNTQYQNLVEEDDVFNGGFYVPDNVYIIGTMNDIDRNVESMDFAIRRRFTWEEIKPTEASLAAMLAKLELKDGVKKEAGLRMVQLNAAISKHKNDGLGDAYQIGPSYFRKLDNYRQDADGGFGNLWAKHLEPLIREYLRGMPKADDILKELESAYNRQALAEARGS